MSAIDILAINDSPFPCFVSGELSTTNSTFKVIDPHERSRTLREVYCADIEESTKAIDSAANALVGKFDSYSLCLFNYPRRYQANEPNDLAAEWRSTTIDSRRHIILQAASILRERMGEFVKIMVEETTITKSFASLNVMLAIWW